MGREKNQNNNSQGGKTLNSSQILFCAEEMEQPARRRKTIKEAIENIEEIIEILDKYPGSSKCEMDKGVLHKDLAEEASELSSLLKEIVAAKEIIRSSKNWKTIEEIYNKDFVAMVLDGDHKIADILRPFVLDGSDLDEGRRLGDKIVLSKKVYPVNLIAMIFFYKKLNRSSDVKGFIKCFNKTDPYWHLLLSLKEDGYMEIGNQNFDISVEEIPNCYYEINWKLLRLKKWMDLSGT